MYSVSENQSVARLTLDRYGRQVLYVSTYGIMTIFNAGAAGSHNIQTLIILRLLAGSFGSSVLTNAGGVIADIFPASQRGLALAVFAAAPFLGPTIGPIVGGFLAMTKGWRWVEGLMAIFTGALWIFGALYVPETYAPVILRRRAAELSKQTGKVYRTRQEVDAGPISAGTAFKTALSRPWILLFREPIVLLLSTYMAIIYGTLYMCFGAFPIVFQQVRGWNQGVGGLAFLGVAVGMLIAVLYTIPENKRYNREAAKAGGSAPPEARLKPAMIGSVAIPFGLFWFAWTNYPSIHWFSAVAAGAPFGFGMVLVFLSIMNYLIDSYTIFAASVLAANSVLRSLFGATFPLFTSYMYKGLGIHWASSVPAFLALICVPFPFIFFQYGPAIRSRCKFAAESDAFMKRMRDENAAGESEDEMQEEREKEVEQDFGEHPSHTSSSTSSTSSARPREVRRLEKIKTGASAKSSKSVVYEGNPYDIDRVNSHASGLLSRTGTKSAA
jgi:MFS family permease